MRSASDESCVMRAPQSTDWHPSDTHTTLQAVAIPILIFVVCLCAGAFAGAQWVPGLDAGPVGGLAFFVVCGLIGAGLGAIGLNIYEIAESPGALGTTGEHVVIASGLHQMLFEGGTLFALAAGVYLLAPPSPEYEDDQGQAHNEPDTAAAAG